MQIIDGLTNPRVAPLPPPVIPASEHLSLTYVSDQVLMANPYDVPRPMSDDSEDDIDEEMKVEQDLTPASPLVPKPSLQRDPSGKCCGNILTTDVHQDTSLTAKTWRVQRNFHHSRSEVLARIRQHRRSQAYRTNIPRPQSLLISLRALLLSKQVLSTHRM